VFVELMPILAGRTVLITVAKVDDKTLRVNVIPTQAKADENPALSTPLTYTGSPEELDAELGKHLAGYVQTHQRELLGLDRLRLIAAAAKGKGEEVARTTLGLEGQARSLKELVEARVEEPAEVEARLGEVSSRLETLEAEKRVAQQRLLELQAAEASRKPLLAEVETLKQRLRKTDAEITQTKRQIGKDESLLTGKKNLADLTKRGAALATRIEELHRQIRGIQGRETSNRETERTVQTLDEELRANFAELDRLRVERAELAIVPCGGEGPYASCPKIRRAVEAGQKIPTLEGDIATLSIEVEVQRGSLVQIATPSSELTRTLEGCE
jgi:PRTRC genetic system protein E